jgi:hypothetical protein
VLKAPGVVLMHDVHLLPLYAEMHALRHPYDPYWLEDKLIEMYGDRIPRADLLRVPYDRPERARGLYMTREIQAHADRILVHTHRQAGIMRLERPDDAAPVEVVPRAIPETPTAAFARSAEGTPVIPLGSPSPKLAEAIERLGGGPPAPVAVQMDASDAGPNGWRAVGDAIAARVPVIAVGASWEEELPSPVVIPLPADCTAAELAERIDAAARDEALRTEVREAQDAYAAEHSFARVAERYADLLNL